MKVFRNVFPFNHYSVSLTKKKWIDKLVNKRAMFGESIINPPTLKQFGCNYNLYFGLLLDCSIYHRKYTWSRKLYFLIIYCLPIIFGYRDELFYTIWTEFLTNFARKKKQVIVFVLTKIDVWLKRSSIVQFTFSYIYSRKNVYTQLKHFILLSSI